MKKSEFVPFLDKVFKEVVEYFEFSQRSYPDEVKENRFDTLCSGALLALKLSYSGFDVLFATVYFSYKTDLYFGGEKSE